MQRIALKAWLRAKLYNAFGPAMTVPMYTVFRGFDSLALLYFHEISDKISFIYKVLRYSLGNRGPIPLKHRRGNHVKWTKGNLYVKILGFT